MMIKFNLIRRSKIMEVLKNNGNINNCIENSVMLDFNPIGEVMIVVGVGDAIMLYVVVKTMVFIVNDKPVNVLIVEDDDE